MQFYSSKKEEYIVHAILFLSNEEYEKASFFKCFIKSVTKNKFLCHVFWNYCACIQGLLIVIIFERHLVCQILEWLLGLWQMQSIKFQQIFKRLYYLNILVLNGIVLLF